MKLADDSKGTEGVQNVVSQPYCQIWGTRDEDLGVSGYKLPGCYLLRSHYQRSLATNPGPGTGRTIVAAGNMPRLA